VAASAKIRQSETIFHGDNRNGEMAKKAKKEAAVAKSSVAAASAGGSWRRNVASEESGVSAGSEKRQSVANENRQYLISMKS
jgi:hypothetical protein